mmetsp:Transcript_26074/g.56529  ORF Transcript_26074/g.56529 Transcript_26074/m.56529 type:complete len:301 (-) Transcript_26074:304-1206(-)
MLLVSRCKAASHFRIFSNGGCWTRDHHTPKHFTPRTRPLLKPQRSSFGLISLRSQADFCSSSQVDTMNTRRAKFVLFGDSLTQRGFQEGGWCGRLAAVHERTADIVLRGYWGYNSRWAVELLPHVFPKESEAPDLVTILLGSNDAVLPDLGKAESKQHVPLEEYKQNLTTIINHIKSLKAARPCSILLMTPPPIDHDKWQQFRMENFVPPPPPTRNRDLEHTRKYAAAALQEWKGYLLDGLHFNPKGNGVVFEAVRDAVARHHPHLHHAALPTQFPEFADIDTDTEDYLQAFSTTTRSSL